MMRLDRMLISILAAGAVWLSAAGAATAAATAALPLKRVMLSTGGVGYFEHEAVVDGDAVLELAVRLDQVDDVLKSIVVYDDSGGIGTVSLPGRAPLKQVFRDLPFDQAVLSSPVALLNALQGAEIEAVGARALRGRLIRVTPEHVKLPGNGGTVTRHRVSLMTAQGIQHLIFEEAESLRFADAALREQISQALAAIATHRVRDKRTLRVTIKGAGRRTVRVAYVVAAPLWKTSYRLTLTNEDGAPRGRLHGWAVVENMSGHDWRDVELTLLSGNPVTFRQALYSAYYVDRPSVPVEVLGRILPRPDTGVIGGAAVAQPQHRRLERRKGRRADLRKARSAMAKESVRAAGAAGRYEESDAIFAAPPPRAMQMAAPVRTAVSRDAATQVIFRVPGKLSVTTGYSLMVPIVNHDIPAQRISLYQYQTHPSHPLAAVRLTNDSGSGLPPGVITLYQRDERGADVAFLGDARLNTLPVGEHRLVSFALDQKTRVDREVERHRILAKAAIQRGVFRRTYTEQRITKYRIKAPPGAGRTVLIEHPRLAGWSMARPGKDDVEMTADKYRIQLKLDKGGRETLTVVMERPRQETLAIASLSSPQIAAFARTTDLSATVRRAFARMAELRNALEGRRAEVRKLDEERKQIFTDQSRIRGNLNRIPRGSDLHRRYLQKLNRQEDGLEALHIALAEARARQKAAENALAKFVGNLKI